MSTPSDARIEELIERSSLGSEGARQLRARTTEDQLDRIRRLAHAPAEAAEAAMLLPPRAPEYEDHAFGAPVRVADSSIRPQAPHGPTARSADPPMSASSAAQGGPTSYDQLDDHELLRLHVAGNPDSFGYLVKRHRDRMWAVAIRTLGEPEEAADALQEAFISAFRRADSFRGDAKVTTWLHRIVVNACLDRIRRRQVRAADPLPEDEDRTSALAGPAEDDPAEVRERRRDVLNALKQVNADQRNALVLVDLEGYSIEEAAAILGCAPGTVKSRCARGRARVIPLLRHWRTTWQADDRPDADTESTSIPPTPSAP